jgi:hypothetical protein
MLRVCLTFIGRGQHVVATSVTLVPQARQPRTNSRKNGLILARKFIRLCIRHCPNRACSLSRTWVENVVEVVESACRRADLLLRRLTRLK